MTFQTVKPQELITNALKDVFPIDKKDTVSITLSDSLPLLWGDKALLQQLFTNLISNAIKYSQKKQNPTIEIGGEETEDFTIINIKDNGIGIDMKYANKIFEVFSRLVGEEEYDGTGLGLAIVHRIISRHDGEIYVESKVGKETIFWVKLPKKKRLEKC